MWRAHNRFFTALNFYTFWWNYWGASPYDRIGAYHHVNYSTPNNTHTFLNKRQFITVQEIGGEMKIVHGVFVYCNQLFWRSTTMILTAEWINIDKEILSILWHFSAVSEINLRHFFYKQPETGLKLEIAWNIS